METILKKDAAPFLTDHQIMNSRQREVPRPQIHGQGQQRAENEATDFSATSAIVRRSMLFVF
jgi:hypothetical protein